MDFNALAWHLLVFHTSQPYSKLGRNIAMRMHLWVLKFLAKKLCKTRYKPLNFCLLRTTGDLIDLSLNASLLNWISQRGRLSPPQFHLPETLLTFEKNYNSTLLASLFSLKTPTFTIIMYNITQILMLIWSHLLLQIICKQRTGQRIFIKTLTLNCKHFSISGNWHIRTLLRFMSYL